MLQDNLGVKMELLRNVEMWKQLYFKKMCLHFYVFHENLCRDTTFFTNFLQLAGGVSITSNENGADVDYEYLQFVCLMDMFRSNDYSLFSVFHYIFN